jgi:hypothetical protein
MHINVNFFFPTQYLIEKIQTYYENYPYSSHFVRQRRMSKRRTSNDAEFLNFDSNAHSKSYFMIRGVNFNFLNECYSLKFWILYTAIVLRTITTARAKNRFSADSGVPLMWLRCSPQGAYDSVTRPGRLSCAMCNNKEHSCRDPLKICSPVS